MSQRGIDFLNEWISENINADVYPQENDGRVKEHVAELTAAAKQAGVSVKEIEEDMGGLEDCVFQAMKEATDREVDRLVSKDA